MTYDYDEHPPVCASRLLTTGEPILIERDVKGYWPAPSPDFDPEVDNRDSMAGLGASLTRTATGRRRTWCCCGTSAPGGTRWRYTAASQLEIHRLQYALCTSAPSSYMPTAKQGRSQSCLFGCNSL